jgi:hypothetical protein
MNKEQTVTLKGETTMKKRIGFTIAVLALATSLAVIAPVAAHVPAGCTPGYWKQPHHLDSWGLTPYSPDDRFSDVFGVGPDDTLMEVLRTGGGKEKALYRHAVAGILNAAALGDAYPYNTDPPDPSQPWWTWQHSVIGKVWIVYHGYGDLEMWKGFLEAANEGPPGVEDFCPLN